jgi:exopolyphosphatase/guanosine-5'-triphosphate,3'-diphosphate pyrophosphatase
MKSDLSNDAPTIAASSVERAVIYVGPTSASLLIGSGQDKWTTLEHLDRPLPIARDVFRSGTITRQTVEQATDALRDFLLTCNEYGIDTETIELFNTNILIEAKNHEIFLNRLQVTTGLDARLIDDGDMTRLVYQISLRMLRKNRGLASGKTFVTHIGPGNTRALYFVSGKLTAYSNYRLGIFRAREAVADLEEDSSAGSPWSHLEEQIRGVVDQLTKDYSDLEIDHHVAIGSEIQSVSPAMPGTQVKGARKVAENELARFSEKLSRLTPDELVRELHVHYTGGEGVVPALQTNLALARRFADETVWVPDGDFQRDLMVDMLLSSPRTITFQEEVVQAAREIGVKYHTDRKHAEHVAQFARQIFRELQHWHGLAPRHELLLRVAAILHEVGMFISPREHHKHSLYILLNTEIFGLSTHDRTLVALLARYHRRYNPEPNHSQFSDLGREDRMILFKLVALLRLADALDRSHAQRIRSIQLRPESGRLLIFTQGVEDPSVEQIAINSKCDLFREIYGHEILLTKP